MTESPQQKSMTVRHLNKGLFSDYYLNEVVYEDLFDSDAFVGNADVKRVQDALKALRQKVQPETLDEGQLEIEWIQPVLDILGWHYKVQVKVRYGDSGHRKPDYLFVASEEDAKQLTNQIYTPDELRHALAVGDAKKWGTHLDQSSGEGYPAQQIAQYLWLSELTWGILTDGKIWRLYHRDTSKHNKYYAIDLDALLEADSKDFLYFYAFFRPEAFTGTWLKDVLQGSQDFAEKLTDTLEEEVFEALEMIAQGFLAYRRNKLKPDAPTLRLIYENSLVFLYRVLFLFYAESRGILPLDNDGYNRRLSMDSIRKQVQLEINFNGTIQDDQTRIYARLSDLFFAIDAGVPSYDLPAYNGRLFNDDEHPFLRDNKVGDAYLMPALDKLARVDVKEKRTTKRVFVDYRDLEVRHLGSVYEKLLEYELDIATEPLALKGKGQAYVPAKDEASAIKKAGEVYLRTGNNERKVTGSYYTPDYIVRFIVEKTLAPVLEAIAERHATRDDDGQWHVRDSDALVRDVLALNVLDPATGSGHFVVDATSYIAEWLADLAIRPDDLGDEDELTYWKRQVASACIYAVDINPLAVELAKLSMWLTTLAQGKPLSFLDHHIRVGNSLVGTSIFDISDDLDDEKRRKKRQREQAKAEAVGQMMMFSDDDFADGVAYAVAEMHKIEQTRADDVSVVKQQEAQFEQLKARLKTWQRASDVWTARAFGLSLTAEQWQTIRALRQQDALPNGIAKVVSEAERIAHDNRFFHWELAFPEIFFNEDGTPKDDGGFDAVIGNPPYVRQERITPIKPFLESQYDVYSGTADLFLYFYERGLEFVRDGHRLGYITSGTYMNSNSAKPFRAYLHREAGMEWVANFGENQPFKGAEMVYPTIAVLRRHTPAKTFKHLFMEGNVPFADLQATLEDATWDDSLSEVMGMDEWRFQSAELTRLFQKITQGKKTLLEHVGDVFHYGIKTGFNEAFIIEEDKYQELIKADSKNEEIIKPMLRGQDLRPWYNNESGQYLIFAYQGIDIDAYPTIKAHLAQYRKDLEPKPEDWDNKRDGNWQGRASGSYKWYELQTPFSNPQVFAEPKIMWAEIAKLPRMSLAQDEFYMNNKCYFISSGSYSLLGVLQSRVAWFVAGQIATPLRLRSGLWQYQLFKQFIERLPIPELTDAQEKRLAEIAEKITGLAQARYKAHEGVRETIANEFGAGESISTRVDLYRWWELDDEKALSDELKKRWGREIAIGKRSEWRDYLAKEKAKHEDYTAKIVALEEEMNAIVYEAFDLTPEEIALIEASTKYKYGGV